MHQYQIMFYVIVQFGCIFYLIFNTHLNALNYALIGIGFIIGLSAIIAMKLDNFNIQPALKSQHKLITNGIYHWIRHPMYTSVLTLCLALALSNNHLFSQLALLALTIILILKSNLEEKLLTQRFSDYPTYKKKTGRFIPFL
ncbi:hypothetical protein [uncultured Gammaproteobacteria bacterium]|uniref:methyltransferase family protein n=1 Tax=Bathymodiolus heckerae thiotrophic gill symbiont TaxID=1052212 RepID=UPI0010FE60BA|nr:isoprenylcysteine carboxylmethyltransferase family protein [Bathymodiolus heckerae thiotrophic gill symbiont]CAC9443870.1 hypothetical protein [uncultured Gammaproteobacteria bacterium]